MLETTDIEVLLNRYGIEFKYGGKEEVAEGLKRFDEALLSLGYDIADDSPKETYTTEQALCKKHTVYKESLVYTTVPISVYAA